MAPTCLPAQMRGRLHGVSPRILQRADVLAQLDSRQVGQDMEQIPSLAGIADGFVRGDSLANPVSGGDKALATAHVRT